LEEAIETETPDSGSINPAVFEEDQDIQYDISRNFLDVDLGPAYIVKWVNFASQNGTAVWKAKYEGWRVVSGSMVKDIDRDLVKEDNTLRVGDTICMYMRKDHHLQLMQKQEQIRLRQQYGAEAELIELAEKNPKALKVHGTLDQQNPHLSQTQQKAAQKTALSALNKHIKQGTVPGVPVR
jgi:mannose-6-phosphate isomerase-like protein (cupin superfamily)